MGRILSLVMLLAFCALASLPAAAQVPAADLTIGKSSGERRVALVIGNGAYQSAGKLANPVNDAKAMGDKLRKLGFEVISVEDGTQQAMRRAVGQFSNKLTPDAVSLFFYAGHGIQVNGKNYLVPIDADIGSEQTVRLETVDVDAVIEQMAMAKSRISLVILDACRNNPYERRFRGQSGGLASIDAPAGTLIAYATAPGKVAADGSDGNGLYTAELLAAMDLPGAKIEDVFKRVRARVVDRTRGEQTPWEASSLTGDFYFSAPAVTVAAASPSPDRSAARGPDRSVGSADRDALFWQSVKDSRNPAQIQAYLDQFPQGTFAGLAKIMIEDLKRSKPAPVKQAMATPPAAAPQTRAAAPAPRGFPVAVGGSFRDCPNCPELVVVPPGEAMMGSDPDETSREKLPERLASLERPRHKIVLKAALAIGKTPVMRAEYALFVTANGYAGGNGCAVFKDGKFEVDRARTWQDPGFPQTDQHPAVCINWNDAQAYAGWLSRTTGKSYRLLSEAEWEYAARGGTATARYWGDAPADQCRFANGADATARGAAVISLGGNATCADGHVHTSPVGSLAPNRFGLHDMLGNVWQWVEDCMVENYQDAPESAAFAVVGANCTRHVIRGGSWLNSPVILRPAARGVAGNSARNYTHGFRVARAAGD